MLGIRHARAESIDAFDAPTVDSPGAGSSSTGDYGWSGGRRSGLETAPSWRRAFDFAGPEEEVDQVASSGGSRWGGIPEAEGRTDPFEGAAGYKGSSPLDQFVPPPRKSPLDAFLGGDSPPRNGGLDQYLDSPRETPRANGQATQEGRFGGPARGQQGYGWDNGSSATRGGFAQYEDSSDEDSELPTPSPQLKGNEKPSKTATQHAHQAKGSSGYKSLVEEDDEDAYEGLVRLPDFIVLERRQKKWEEEDRKRREEEEKRQRELEAKRRVEEEARRRDAELRRKAEEERKRVEEARRSAEQAKVNSMRQQQQQVKAQSKATSRAAATSAAAYTSLQQAGASNPLVEQQGLGVESLATMKEQVDKLHDLGFTNDAKNAEVLQQTGRNMALAIDTLLQQENGPQGGPLGIAKHNMLSPSRPPPAPAQFRSQLTQLQELGYGNLQLNAQLLQKYKGDMNATLDALAAVEKDNERTQKVRQIPVGGDLLTGEPLQPKEDLKWMFEVIPGGKASKSGAKAPVADAAGVDYYVGKDLNDLGYKMPDWTSETANQSVPQANVPASAATAEDIEDRIQAIMDRVPVQPASASNTPAWTPQSYGVTAGTTRSAPVSRTGSPAPPRLVGPLPEDLFTGAEPKVSKGSDSKPARKGLFGLGTKETAPKAPATSPRQSVQVVRESKQGWSTGPPVNVFSEWNRSEAPSVLSYNATGAENAKPKKGHGLHLFGWGKSQDSKPEPAFSNLAAVKPKSAKELAQEEKERRKEEERLAKELKKREKELRKKEEEILKREKKLIK